MKKQIARVFAAGVSFAALHGVASGETLKSLYEQACLAQGIDKEKCLCILGQVSDNHDDDAVRYLALDMTLRYDAAALLLEKIGEDEALAVGMTFDEAQNLSCSSSRLAQLAGSYQSAGDSEAVSAAIAGEETGKTTLADIVSEPLQLLRGPHPHLDLRAIKGDVEIIISVVMQSKMIQASAGTDIRPHLAWYEIADEAGGIDINGDGQVDIPADAPAYASAVQARTLSPKMYFPRQADTEQVIGQIRLKGGSIYAPVMRFKQPSNAKDPMSMGGLSSMTSVEALTNQMRTPRHLHFAFPLNSDQDSGAFETVSEQSFAFGRNDATADGEVQSQDALIIINYLNNPVAE